MKKGKRIALFVSMVLILAVAAVLNIYLLTDKNGTDTATEPAGSFFTTSREYRMSTREYEISQLDEIIALEGDEYAAARASAIEQKQKLIGAMELELKLETVLQANGFEEIMVSVSPTSDAITVMVGKEEITQQDTVKVYYIIDEELDTEITVSFIAV
jgi:hypothetical protein